MLFLLLCCAGFSRCQAQRAISYNFTHLLYRLIVVTPLVAFIITLSRGWISLDRNKPLIGFLAYFVWAVVTLKVFPVLRLVGLLSTGFGFYLTFLLEHRANRHQLTLLARPPTLKNLQKM